ncbi:MAG TPA: hypothetical protein VGL15_05285 [Vicinamibacteria bacterium]
MRRRLLEYLGFRTTEEGRDYLLRTRLDAEIHGYTVRIAREAFAAGRARFQDGPEISYAKVRDELAAHEDGAIDAVFTINDAELASYRATHTRLPKWVSISH